MLHFEELFGAIFNGTSLKASKINRTLKCFRLSVQTFPCGQFLLKYHKLSLSYSLHCCYLCTPRWRGGQWAPLSGTWRSLAQRTPVGSTPQLRPARRRTSKRPGRTAQRKPGCKEQPEKKVQKLFKTSKTWFYKSLPQYKIIGYKKWLKTRQNWSFNLLKLLTKNVKLKNRNC